MRAAKQEGVVWRDCSLAELGKLVSGGTPARNQPAFWGGRIPWASVKDFSDEDVFLYDTAEHITEAGLAASAATLVPENTPVLCTRMAVGRCALTTRPTAINQDLRAIHMAEELDRRFFIRLLRYHGRHLDRVSVGSTVRGITLPDVRSLLLAMPETVAEQRRIAAVLDTVDLAIAQTEAVIAKLKSVRAGLLHDLLTRGLDANGQLRPPPEQAPHLYKDSLLGKIPREWEAMPLESIASVERGKFTHRPRNDPAYYGGPSPFIQTGDIAEASGEVITEASQFLSGLGVTVSKEFPAGTIAVTIAANIGDTAILGRGMYFPDSVVGVVVKDGHVVRWVELSLRRAKKQLDALAPQSAQKNINLTFLRPLLIPIPPSWEQKICSALYEGMSGQIAVETVATAKLRRAKSGLMSDLLTGRVRVESGSMTEES